MGNRGGSNPPLRIVNETCNPNLTQLMKCEVEDIDACNKNLKIEIPLSDYKSRLKAYYAKLSHQVKVPGFRKGKVPQSMLEKRFGAEVKQEVLSQMVSDSINHGIQEHNLRAVGEPSIVEIKAEEGTDITVTAKVEVVPDFEVKAYNEIELALRIARVTDKEVDQVIDAYRQRHAKSVQVSDRPVEKDDYVKFDFDSTLDGKTYENGSAKDYVIQVGSKNLVEGFDQQMLGMKLGEEKSFTLPMPKDHPNSELAGKDVAFKVVLKGIQIKEPPALDDAFAKIADSKQNYQTMAELKAGVRKGLEEYERKMALKASKKALAEKLAEVNPIDIPERLVKEQIQFMVKKEKDRHAHATGEPHSHDHEHDHGHDHEHSEVTVEEEKQHREAAMKILQQELVIGKLATDLKIQISEQELEGELKSFMSLLGGGDTKKIKKEWSESGALARLHTRMRREKTLDHVIEQVTLKEEMVDRGEIPTDN